MGVWRSHFGTTERDEGEPVRLASRPCHNSGQICGLGFRHRRRKVASFLLILKARCLMRPVAKGFIGRVAAPAERNHLTAGKAKRLAFHIDEFKIPFDSQWTVIPDHNFG